MTIDKQVGAGARSLSCAISGADTVTAVRAVHLAFNFAHQRASLLLLCTGTDASVAKVSDQAVAAAVLSFITHSISLLQGLLESNINLRCCNAEQLSHTAYSRYCITLRDTCTQLQQ
jgi:hypothetical protein